MPLSQARVNAQAFLLNSYKFRLGQRQPSWNDALPHRIQGRWAFQGLKADGSVGDGSYPSHVYLGMGSYMLLLLAVLHSWPKKNSNVLRPKKHLPSNSHRCEVATAHPIVAGKVREPHSNDLGGGSPEGLFWGIDTLQ